MTQKDWYSYGEIRYTPEQIIFLLAHKELLESGRWPPQHIETGYTGSSKGRTYNTEGYFVKAVVTIAELNIRLAATNQDGKLVVERYTDGYDEIDLANRHKLDYFEVVKRIGTALRYCGGFKRKRTTYPDYKAGRNSYLKKRGSSHQA